MKYINNLPTLIIAALLTACGGGGDDKKLDGKISDGGFDNSHVVTIIDPYNETLPEFTDRVLDGGSVQYQVYSQLDYSDSFDISPEGCGGSTLNADGYTFTSNPITSDCTITVRYEPLKPKALLVETLVTGYGGSIKPTSATLPNNLKIDLLADEGKDSLVSDKALTIPVGTTLQFSVNRITGFSAVITGCDASTVNDIIEVTDIQQSCVIEAVFTPNSSNAITIDTSSTIGGSIHPNQAIIPAGTSAEFVVDNGFGFESMITGCGGSLSDENIYVTSTLATDCVIDATFIQKDTAESIITMNVIGKGFVEYPIEVFTNHYETFLISEGSTYMSVPTDIYFESLLIKPSKGHRLVSANGCGTTLEQNEFFVINSAPVDCTMDITFEEDNSESANMPTVPNVITYGYDDTPHNEEFASKSSNFSYVGSSAIFTLDYDQGFIVDRVDSKNWGCLTESNQDIYKTDAIYTACRIFVWLESEVPF